MKLTSNDLELYTKLWHLFAFASIMFLIAYVSSPLGFVRSLLWWGILTSWVMCGITFNIDYWGSLLNQIRKVK